MGDETEISWTDHTFNPWEGCVKVSPECDECYAEERDIRWHEGKNWGPDALRLFHVENYWDKPLKWNREAKKAGVRRRVFCGSLCDMMERHRNPETNAKMDAARAQTYDLVEGTEWLDWLFLTKRSQNYIKLLPEAWLNSPRRNVWLGTTVGVKSSAWRIQELRDTPAAIRFLSCEPLLEDLGTLDLSGIHQVIAGGESGRKARPMHPDWARSLRDQCKAVDVAYHFKQWGEWLPRDQDGGLDRDRAQILNCSNGSLRVGKHAAGRLLDGVEHNGFPGVRANG